MGERRRGEREGVEGVGEQGILLPLKRVSQQMSCSGAEAQPVSGASAGCQVNKTKPACRESFQQGREKPLWVGT